MRTCRTCQKNLSEDNFSKCRRSPGGRVTQCRKCRSERRKELYSGASRDANIRRARSWWRRGQYLKRMYGITPEEYEQLLIKQNRCCAICSSPDPKGGNRARFSVDHDHVTGKVRGLLCNQCNVALGGLGDSVASLGKALEYLENSS